MSERTATIIGGTGLIGSELRQQLRRDLYYSTIRILTRRPIEKQSDREEIKLISFGDAESLKLGLEGSDAVFVTIGTTRKKVKGDRQAYRQVDYEIPLRAAQFAKESGCRSFLVVSSTGASVTSRFFYLRLKGEMEESINKLALPAVHIMRPSSLLGNRPDPRPGEIISARIMKWADFLVPEKYKPVEAGAVAHAMIFLSKELKEGFFIHENPWIRNHASRTI